MHNTKRPNKEHIYRYEEHKPGEESNEVIWEQQGLPSFHRQQPIDSRKIISSISGSVPVAQIAGKK